MVPLILNIDEWSNCLDYDNRAIYTQSNRGFGNGYGHGYGSENFMIYTGICGIGHGDGMGKGI
jgi:hypothetical protein